MAAYGFFDFRHLMSQKNLPCNSLGSQLSFESVKVALSPPSGAEIVILDEKSVIFVPKFPTSKCLDFGICHSFILPEYTSHTPGPFVELDPPDEVSGSVLYIIMYING